MFSVTIVRGNLSIIEAAIRTNGWGRLCLSGSYDRSKLLKSLRRTLTPQDAPGGGGGDSLNGMGRLVGHLRQMLLAGGSI
jgi:hypothetical protein